MIIPDKKKAATIILSRLGKGGAEQSAPLMPEDELGEDSDLKAIAEDIMMAFEHRSAMELTQALKSFVACIQEEDEEQDAQ